MPIALVHVRVIEARSAAIFLQLRWRAMKLFRNPKERKLLAALAARGVNSPWVSGADAWAAFKDYGRTIALGGGTGLLFQVGTYDFEGHPMFYFDPVCQFEVLGPHGEHRGFEQLHCELACPPSPALDGIATTLWSFEFDDADAFFVAVEALPEFKAAVAQGSYRLRVSYESV